MIPKSWDAPVGEVVYDGPRTILYRSTLAEGGRPVILKVLKPPFDDAPHRARLEREYGIAKTVPSTAAVTPYGLTRYEQRLALVLEDFGGAALNRTLPRPAPIDQLLSVAVRVAVALAAVHRLGIVHRDVKPANLLHNKATGEVKIADFGIAMYVGSDSFRSSPGLEGTLAYIAPEQTGRMRRGVDHRADLYSLGVTLFELLTGERPFVAVDPLGWVHGHLARVPRRPAEVDPQVPDALSNLILKLLAKAPEERYQSADGLRHDLESCLDDFARLGTIRPFELGRSDLSDLFRIPRRVVGREREAKVLASAFERVATSGGTELLLVSGYSGVGKSTLVRELRTPVAARDGLFVYGKFDQSRRDVPYAALTQAGQNLIREMISAGPETISAWKAELDQALMGNAGALFSVFGALEPIVGSQPALAELRPSEAQHRLQFAVRAFLRTTAKPDRPLVFFLDDMQWSDHASLDLLESLMADRSLGSCLFILAYRENEVPDSHPFHVAMERIRSGVVRVEALPLGPLDAEGVCAIVADALRDTRSACEALATLIRRKTEGNPFFVHEFLRTLYIEGLLRREGGTWVWKEGDVEARAITENVVDLMVEQLQKLTSGSQRLLRVAACIGSPFDIDDLAAVVRLSPSEVTADLEEPIALGFVARESDVAGRTLGRFSHDRIQQSAYALIDEDRKREAHLIVGRRLWERLGADCTGERLFEIANHLEVAFDLIEDAAERERLLALEIGAARKAKGATAYTQASRYLARAAQILGPSGWSERYEQTFDVRIELAECEYLAGHLDRARHGFTELLDQAASDIDRGRVYYLQILLFQVAGDFAQAAALALRSFELFEVSAPATDALAAIAVAQESALVLELLGSSPIAAHIDDPLMVDRRIRMLASLLEASGPPLYMVKPALFPWLALKLVTYSLRYGNAGASCYGYGLYGILRAGGMGDVEGGYAFAQLAIALNEKLDATKLAGCMLHLLGDHVNFWKNPISTDMPILERGFAACVRGGDHIYSNYIGFQSPWHLYETGAPLDQVWKLTEKYARFALETNYAPVHQTLLIEQNFLGALTGRGRPQNEEGVFDEASALSRIASARFGCGIVYHHILKLIERFTFGDYAGALASAEQAEPELGSAFSMPIYVSYVFYRALTLSALCALARAEPREDALAKVAEALCTLRGWAKACPENFEHKAALVEAEMARATGDLGGAMRAYERSRVAARSQGMVQYEALACELAARLYGETGVGSLAHRLFADAHALYRRWGAFAKATELSERHGGFDAPANAADANGASTASLSSATSSTTARHLDVLPVVKAAQSLSAEIVLPRLLERLMNIVLEHAGAQRGCLLLLRGDELVVAARADAEGTGPASGFAGPPALSSDVPLSVVAHVRHTMNIVLIEDAKRANSFAADPHFSGAAHRAVLCKPLVRQGRLIGMFYLENDLIGGAFDAERLAILEVLASQTAISIENSRLYEASQAAIVARDHFLSIASHELRTPMTPISMHLQNLMSMLRRGPLNEVPQERLMKVVTTCDAQLSRLTRLVEALLDVSRIGAGEFALRREAVDLGALAVEVIERHGAEIAGAACTVDVQAEQGIVGHWDKLRIEQVFTNLLLNAAKFGPRELIQIVARRDLGVARLEVRDHGVGIPRQDHARVFRLFERVQSKDNVDGLGLGLFIARAIVEAHQGKIAIADRPGRGTTFQVELPLQASAAHVRQGPELSPRLPPSSSR